MNENIYLQADKFEDGQSVSFVNGDTNSQLWNREKDFHVPYNTIQVKIGRYAGIEISAGKDNLFR
jgi:hypothetical protein